MKLNADYVRDILLFIEKELDYEDAESNTPHIHKEITDGQLVYNKHFDKYNKQELSYALELLIKEGFIDLAAKPNIHNGNINIARIIGLTWQGHELLDNIRNNTTERTSDGTITTNKTINNYINNKTNNINSDALQTIITLLQSIADSTLSTSQKMELLKKSGVGNTTTNNIITTNNSNNEAPIINSSSANSPSKNEELAHKIAVGV